QGKLDHAETMYRQAVHLQPSAARGLAARWLALADTLFRQNKVEEALAAFRRAAELEPGSPEVHTSLGTALISLGQTDQAIFHLHEAIRLQPDYVPAYAFLGELARESGHSLSAAETDAMRALLTNPGTSPANQVMLHFALGDVHERLGEYDEAFAQYRRANELQHQINVQEGSA